MQNTTKKRAAALAVIATLAVPMALTGCGGNSEPAGKYVAGTYTAESRGMGPITVTVTVDDNDITDVAIEGTGETAGRGGKEAIEDGTFAAQIDRGPVRRDRRHHRRHPDHQRREGRPGPRPGPGREQVAPFREPSLRDNAAPPRATKPEGALLLKSRASKMLQANNLQSAVSCTSDDNQPSRRFRSNSYN